MASEVGVSRITLSKHIRESRVTADAFEGNRTIPAGISDARESWAARQSRPQLALSAQWRTSLCKLILIPSVSITPKIT
jgi:hypothetical protein